MESKTEKKSKFYAGGFLYNKKNNSVLLHLRDNKTPIHPNQWGFFGGLNEGNESPKECFIREIKEELGIDIGVEQIIPVCDYLNKERLTWRHVFYIESDLPKSQMILGEGADFEWISFDKVFEYNLTEKTKQDLKTFLKIRTE